MRLFEPVRTVAHGFNKEKLMKRALRDAAVFILCFLVIFHILDRMTFDISNTSSTWEYIQERDSEPIDILFMGNSHAFCDVNPTIINQAMDLNTMILGASSQPMDQIYENLRLLLRYVHPKVIVLEAEGLLLTTDALLKRGKEGYLYSNFDSIRDPITRLRAIIDTVNWYEKWPEAYSQLIRPVNTWTRFNSHEAELLDMGKRYNFILGYCPRHNIIETDVEPAIIEQRLIEAREQKEDEVLNVTYPIDTLDAFLDLAAREKIPVYIFKAPILSYETELPKVAGILAEKEQSDSKINGYVNYSEQMTRIGIEKDDFSDIGHLNREGANKFTIHIMDWLSGELGIPYDLSKVTGIREESFQKLPDGRYRYTVSLFDNTVIKFIARNENGEVVSETEYSDINYIEMPRISERNKLSYRIRAKKEIPGRNYPFDSIEYKFMHETGE